MISDTKLTSVKIITDSDALIVKGLLSILERLVNNSSIDDIKGLNGSEILNNIGGGCSIPIGVITLSKTYFLDTIACIVDPQTGKKTIVKESNFEGKGKELAKIISKFNLLF